MYRVASIGAPLIDYQYTLQVNGHSMYVIKCLIIEHSSKLDSSYARLWRFKSQTAVQLLR